MEDAKKIQKREKITIDEALEQARKEASFGDSSNDGKIINLFMEYKDCCKDCCCKIS